MSDRVALEDAKRSLGVLLEDTLNRLEEEEFNKRRGIFSRFSKFRLVARLGDSDIFVTYVLDSDRCQLTPPPRNDIDAVSRTASIPSTILSFDVVPVRVDLI